MKSATRMTGNSAMRTTQDLAKLAALTNTQVPERIYHWQHNQMSIARHYGGLRYMGHDYTIAPNEDGTPLVRSDVLAKEAKAARVAKRELSTIIQKKIIEAQGCLL